MKLNGKIKTTTDSMTGITGANPVMKSPMSAKFDPMNGSFKQPGAGKPNPKGMIPNNKNEYDGRC